jgi:hypothetical protein
VSLIDELEGVQMAIVDRDRQLVYCWYGGTGVNVYDTDGREVDYFSLNGGSTGRPSPEVVRAAIEATIAEADDYEDD